VFEDRETRSRRSEASSRRDEIMMDAREAALFKKKITRAKRIDEILRRIQNRIIRMLGVNDIEF
jgi:hypothetical protein